jgi:hypothetical protein
MNSQIGASVLDRNLARELTNTSIPLEVKTGYLEDSNFDNA